MSNKTYERAELCVNCQYCEFLAIKGNSTKLYGCRYSKSPKYVFTRACKNHYKEKINDG